MLRRDELRARLQAFDRKSFSILTETAAALSHEKTYPAALVALCVDKNENLLKAGS